MDPTTKKLLQLLDGGDLELRMAAMRIVTELEISDRTVTRALGRALREDSQPLKLLALRGLMKLGARDVIDMVIPLILEPGELREQALSVVVAIGETAVAPLKALYPDADFHGKRAIATALSRIGASRSVEFLLEHLLTEPFELQKHLSQCLCEAIDGLPPKNQRPLFNLVKKFLSSPKVKKDLQAQVVGLILLGHFRDDRDVLAARKVLRNYAAPRQQPEVRRYALMSLSRSILEAKIDNELINFLTKCLCDEDWHNVASHAIGAFQRIELPRARNLKLVSLLKDSPHFSVHIHVFERLTKENRPEVAKAILPFLRDSRFRVRESAERALRAMPAAIGDLFTVLSDSVDTDLSQRLHAIVRDYPQEVKRKYLDRAIHRFMTLYERNDRRAQFFLDLVRSIDPEPLRRRIYQKVESLRSGRSKDRWLKISRYLQILWDHHLITPEGRYTFAVALIRESNKDLSPHARRANLGVQVLRALIYDDTPGLVAKLCRSKDVTPDDIFYIGFHFMEEGEELRPFARALLEHLVKKSPGSKVGKAAAHKLGLHAATEGRVVSAAAARAAARTKQGGRKSAAPAAKPAAPKSAAAKPAKAAKKSAKPAAKKSTKKSTSAKPAKGVKKSSKAAGKTSRPQAASKGKAAKKPAKKPAKKTTTKKKPAKATTAKKKSTKKTTAKKKAGKKTSKKGGKKTSRKGAAKSSGKKKRR